MNLLPKSRTEFGETQYWDKFFTQRGKKSFDWYGEYPELCGQLHKYIKPKDDILMLGCGNSKLSADLYDVGYRKLRNIDISHIVVKQMNDLHRNQRPEMIFEQMDATAMTYTDGTFTVALDKGTLDALMPDAAEETVKMVDKYFNEISRILRPTGGRYVCVSLLQQHILQKVLEYFPQNNFMLRFIRCFEAEEKTKLDNPDSFAMPVFLIVATKFPKLPQQILEVCLIGDHIQRLETVAQMSNEIDSVQKSALVCSNLNKSDKAACDELKIDLMSPDNQASPRYSIIVIDREVLQSRLGKFAAFIVPQGREVDWLFSTKEGRQKLLESAGFNRLAVVLLHRDHTYSSLDDVKAELSSSIKQLAPNNLKNDLIPFLSLGNDVGQREIIFRGHSQLSGEYVVEEVINDDGDAMRRLIFMNNQFVVQSEAKMKSVTKKKGKIEKKVVDLSYLACDHHLYMTCGVTTAVADSGNGRIAVIGLGGGGLCIFIQQILKLATIVAVDIDEAMLKVATDYFGLTLSDRLQVVIEDGLAFLRRTATEAEKYDAILLDVDSKDRSMGISCPPKSFLEPPTLENVKASLSNHGLLVLNLVCRDDKLRDSAIATLCQSFATVFTYKLDEELNEIVYCAKSLSRDLSKRILSATEKINNNIKKQKLNQGNVIDLMDLECKLKDLSC